MQLAVVLAVIATLAAADTAPREPAPFGYAKLAAVFLGMSIVVVAAWGISASTVATIDAKPELLPRARRQFHVWLQAHLGLWLVVSFVILTIFDWPRLIRGNWSISASVLGDEVVLLMPILLPLFMSWAAFYDADRLLAPDGTQWTRAQYVGHQLRCFLLPPLVPVLLVTVFSDLFGYLCPQWSARSWSPVVRAVPLVAIIAAFPLVLRYLWRTEPLPAGPLRERLLRRCAEFDFRLCDILIWKTEGRMMNAAISGPLPPWRYVLLTDALLERLSDDEIDLVFLHELGHAKHRHALRLLAGIVVTISASLVIAFKPSFDLVSFSHATSSSSFNSTWQQIEVIVLLLASLSLVGIYARLSELQADLWAVSHAAPISKDGYLDALCKLTGPSRAGWLHPSFHRRQQFLKRGGDGRRWLGRRLRATECLMAFAPCAALVAMAWTSA